MKPEFYAALFTMHGTIMIFFVLSAALIGGFGNFLIPLQVGARDMAFPRLNALSYWIYALSSVVILASFFAPSGPAASGWTAYPPLSVLKGAIPGSNLGQDLWLVAMALFIVSFTLGGLNFLATIVALRRPDLSMMDLPLFTWSMLFVAILGLLAFPSLTAASLMLLLDRHAGTSFFMPMGLVLSGEAIPGRGRVAPSLAAPVLVPWTPRGLHPDAALAGPDLGPVLRLHRPKGVRLSLDGLRHGLHLGHEFPGLGSPHVRLGHESVPRIRLRGHHHAHRRAFGGQGLQLDGHPVESAPPAEHADAVGPGHLLACSSRAAFPGSGSARPRSTSSFTTPRSWSAHFHIIMAGAALFGVFAGVHYWFPLFFGRLMDERLGRAHFLLTFVFYYATFFPMHLAGLRGQVRRVYDPYQYEYLKPLASMNAFITWAAVALAVAQLLFFFNFFRSLRRGTRAGSNPWGAGSLEWSEPGPAEAVR